MLVGFTVFGIWLAAGHISKRRLRYNQHSTKSSLHLNLIFFKDQGWLIRLRENTTSPHTSVTFVICDAPLSSNKANPIPTTENHSLLCFWLYDILWDQFYLHPVSLYHGLPLGLLKTQFTWFNLFKVFRVLVRVSLMNLGLSNSASQVATFSGQCAPKN